MIPYSKEISQQCSTTWGNISAMISTMWKYLNFDQQNEEISQQWSAQWGNNWAMINNIRKYHSNDQHKWGQWSAWKYQIIPRKGKFYQLCIQHLTACKPKKSQWNIPLTMHKIYISLGEKLIFSTHKHWHFGRIIELSALCLLVVKLRWSYIKTFFMNCWL